MIRAIDRARSAVGGARRWVRSLGVRRIRALVDRFRRSSVAPPPPPRRAPPQEEHADERTLRRVAESQNGGVSSEESRARYARGDNPGGLHHQGAPLPETDIEEDFEPGAPHVDRGRGGRARTGRGRPYHRRGAA